MVAGLHVMLLLFDKPSLLGQAIAHQLLACALCVRAGQGFLLLGRTYRLLWLLLLCASRVEDASDTGCNTQHQNHTTASDSVWLPVM
jgi:hypothetical protein